MNIPQEEHQGHNIPDANWPFQGQIEFHNVTLKYMPSLPPALRDLSLTITGGTQVCKFTIINSDRIIRFFLENVFF